MKRHLPGLIVFLVASVVLGLLFGNVFFGLFVQTVPPAIITSFNKSAAHAAFLTYGFGAGVVMFVWGLVAIAGAKLFGKRGGSVKTLD